MWNTPKLPLKTACLTKRKIQKQFSNLPSDSLYLELNALPLQNKIIACRLLFYWTILNKPDTELVKQVLKSQQFMPAKNSWCLTIAKDLEYILTLT